MSDEAKRKKAFTEMLAANPHVAPSGAMEIGQMLSDYLKAAVADEGTSIDTGAGFGSFDLWVTVGGEEFYIEIKKSGHQLAKEAA